MTSIRGYLSWHTRLVSLGRLSYHFNIFLLLTSWPLYSYIYRSSWRPVEVVISVCMKTTVWATSWKNQSLGICDQVWLKPACSITEACCIWLCSYKTRCQVTLGNPILVDSSLATRPSEIERLSDPLWPSYLCLREGLEYVSFSCLLYTDPFI